jgi:aerobic-type carbon monoxide dehydrogenase small subunit (CoxS/CutS family)
MILKKKISLVVNGKVVQSAAVPGISLASFLHENLGLTGTKVACAMGICKACTVALRDEKTSSISRLQACITPVESINGRSVLTVEGIEYEARFKPLQEAFLKHFSFQCGYCTPGFLLGASLLIDQLRLNPVKADQLDRLILEGVGDHICRCSGYSRYYSAIKEVILKTSGLTLS